MGLLWPITRGRNTGDETTTRIGTLISGATAKTTPAANDMVALMDSAASNVVKKISWTNIKAAIKAYTDTLYIAVANAYVHPTADGSKHVPETGTTNENKALIAGATAGVMAWGAVPAVSTTSVISSGSGAPSSTPGKVGDTYIDTAGKKLYIATAATASTDWTLVGPA
jgi:hypothetical protein